MANCTGDVTHETGQQQPSNESSSLLVCDGKRMAGLDPACAQQCEQQKAYALRPFNQAARHAWWEALRKLKAM